MMTLNQLLPRQAGRVISVRSIGPVTGRLLAMGILPGVLIRVVGVAPLGDPMMVQLDGCRLSLRLEEAAALTVEPT
ncbi:MAG: FeoA family protein [Phycisphaerales bacterium]